MGHMIQSSITKTVNEKPNEQKLCMPILHQEPRKSRWVPESPEMSLPSCKRHPSVRTGLPGCAHCDCGPCECRSLDGLTPNNIHRVCIAKITWYIHLFKQEHVYDKKILKINKKPLLNLQTRMQKQSPSPRCSNAREMAAMPAKISQTTCVPPCLSLRPQKIR